MTFRKMLFLFSLANFLHSQAKAQMEINKTGLVYWGSTCNYRYIIKQDSFHITVEASKGLKIPSKKDSLLQVSNDTRISLRCGLSVQTGKPVLVIDGVIVETDSLNSLNPDDILSIDILKGSSAQALFGYKAMNGVIIITTKSADQKEFIIKDVVDGKPLVGATVSYLNESKENITVATDKEGRVRLNAGNNSLIKISAVGYKTLQFKPGDKKSLPAVLLMEREYRVCQEVITVCLGIRRSRLRYSDKTKPLAKESLQPSILFLCRIPGITITTQKEIPGQKNIPPFASFKIYPNPIQRGQIITIDFENNVDETLLVRIVASDGKSFYSGERAVQKGLNEIQLPVKSNFPAGIYYVQLVSQGKLVSTKQIFIN